MKCNRYQSTIKNHNIPGGTLRKR